MVSENSNALMSNKPLDVSTSSSIANMLEDIKQCQWTRPVAIGAVSGLALALACTGIYLAIDWKKGGTGSYKDINWPWKRDQGWWPWNWEGKPRTAWNNHFNIIQKLLVLSENVKYFCGYNFRMTRAFLFRAIVAAHTWLTT